MIRGASSVMKDSQPDQSQEFPSGDGEADTIAADDAVASPAADRSAADADGDSVEPWLAALASAPAIGVGPSVGEVIGGEYRIDQRLGEGSMGVVYLAHHSALDRRVAIKLHRTTTGRAAERLLREAQTVAKVQHDNVLVVHGVGTWKDHVFVAMEYVDGGSARQWLAKQPRTWREIVALYVEAGRGLAAAHAAGVIHRDFKPDNVLVARDAAHPNSLGSVRVADFGLAVRLELETTSDDLPAVPSRVASAQLSGLVGSPAYMAPEQYGRGSIDARADQFAFCVALWEATFGRRPFEGEDLRELAAAIIAGDLVEPTGDVPTHVRKVLRRGLSRDRDARYPDMDALLAELVRDPSAARRRGLLVGVAVGVTALATWAATRRPDPIAGCTDAPVIASWYTPDAAERLRVAMVSSGRSFAADAFASVDAALVERSRAATNSLDTACRATHEEGTRSVVDLDAHRECLAQRGREVTALLDVLGRGDPEIVDRSVSATAALTPIERCDSKTGDDDLGDVGSDERPQVDAALEVIARVSQLEAAGRFDEVIELAQLRRADVEALDRPRLLAQLLLVLGTAQGSLRLNHLASATLREASAAAIRSGVDLVAAEVAIEALFVDGYLAKSRELGEHWAQLGFAWVARAGWPSDLTRELLAHRALALRADDRYVEALADQTFALALLERDDPDNGLSRAGLLAAFGATLREMGEPAAALPIVQQAQAAYAASVGEEHPYTINAWNLVAGVHWAMGDTAEAERLFRHIIDVGGRTLGPKSPRLFDVRANLAMVLSTVGRRDEALEIQSAVVADWKAAGVERDENMIRAVAHLAQTYSELGQGARGRRMHAEAIALAREIAGPESLLYAHQLVADGNLHLEIDPAHALARAVEGETIMSKHVGVDVMEHVMAQMVRGISLAYLDRCAEATPELEHVLDELVTRIGTHPVTIGPRAALGSCRMADGRWDDAIAELEQAALLNDASFPPSERILGWREQAYRGKGDTRRANELRRLRELAAAKTAIE